MKYEICKIIINYFLLIHDRKIMKNNKTRKNIQQDLSQSKRNSIKLQETEVSVNELSVSFSQKIKGNHFSQSLMGSSTKSQRL
jgi:hypothetical protein